MQQTNTLIVGASISGLASAASLQKQGIQYIIIEKQGQAAAPWRNHYHRLHLHTNKRKGMRCQFYLRGLIINIDSKSRQ